MIPEHIKAMFAAFSVAYPNWEMFKKSGPELERAMGTWASMLADCDPRAVLTAATLHARTSKFAPTIAEIREHCTPPKAKPLTAAEAWTQVRAAITANGYMRQPKFKDQSIDRAIEAMGGWYNLATQLTADVPANRAHFMRCFEALAGRAVEQREYDATQKLLAGAAKQIGGGRLAALYGKDYRDPLPDPTDVERHERFQRLKAEDPDAVDEDPF